MSSITSPRKNKVFYKEQSEMEDDYLVLQTNNDRILTKQNEIFKVKEKMYQVRYDDTLPKDEIIQTLHVRA